MIGFFYDWLVCLCHSVPKKKQNTSQVELFSKKKPSKPEPFPAQPYPWSLQCSDPGQPDRMHSSIRKAIKPGMRAWSSLSTLSTLVTAPVKFTHQFLARPCRFSLWLPWYVQLFAFDLGILESRLPADLYGSQISWPHDPHVRGYIWGPDPLEISVGCAYMFLLILCISDLSPLILKL